jgi:hypothetical protein
VQTHVAALHFRIGDSVVSQVRASLGDLSTMDCHAQVRRLIAALCADDFAWVESFPDTPKGFINADVYGRRDEHGIWFIKLAFHRDRARIYSCHLAEHEMKLKNGTVLRRTP